MDKSIEVKLRGGGTQSLDMSRIRYAKIMEGGSKDAPPHVKINMNGETGPIATAHTAGELRGLGLPLVYVGGGVYVPRANIRQIEPLTDADRQGLQDQKGIDAAKFHSRLVLTGGMRPVWCVKSIDQLNERGMRFLAVGKSAHIHVQNIRKVTELDDGERARIGQIYGIDASGFRTQIALTGGEKPKLSRMTIAEMRASGLDLVSVGDGEFVARANVKYFTPFTEGDQEELARKYPELEATRFRSKFVLLDHGTMLAAGDVKDLQGAFAAVNIGYDRYVPAPNIQPERIEPFTRDDKKGLSEAGYAMERNWRSSVASINGTMLSPATADQIKQRRDAAMAKAGLAEPQAAAE